MPTWTAAHACAMVLALTGCMEAQSDFYTMSVRGISHYVGGQTADFASKCGALQSLFGAVLSTACVCSPGSVGARAPPFWLSEGAHDGGLRYVIGQQGVVWLTHAGPAHIPPIQAVEGT